VIEKESVFVQIKKIEFVQKKKKKV
jgi:hypothetical protein